MCGRLDSRTKVNLNKRAQSMGGWMCVCVLRRKVSAHRKCATHANARERALQATTSATHPPPKNLHTLSLHSQSAGLLSGTGNVHQLFFFFFVAPRTNARQVQITAGRQPREWTSRVHRQMTSGLLIRLERPLVVDSSPLLFVDCIRIVS